MDLAGGEYPAECVSYDPQTSSWKELAPLEGRIYHTATWTGKKMIIWGGTGHAFLHAGGASFIPPVR